MTALVQAKAIGFRGRLATTDLNLRAGELTCLIGPNGSGKTSLLHAVAGIGSPSGQVMIDGHDIQDLSSAGRQRMLSYLSASRDLKWPLKAADMVVLGLPSETDASQQIEALELAALMNRRVDSLSTGERSRVLIARALAAEPKLLLLDEPTANLDPRWQLKLMEGLRLRLADSGQAILMAVHDLETARVYADRLIIMQDGRIVADGDPGTLLDGPIIPEVFGIRKSALGWRPID